MKGFESILQQARDEYIESNRAKKAEILEYYSVHQVRFRNLLKSLSLNNHTENLRPKVLDVGCYPPILDIALLKSGFEVVGITSTFEPVKYDKIPTIQINVETDRFPYPANHFDVVIFTEILEHLYRSPLEVFREMKRVLKPGGKLIITTPNIARLANRLKFLVGQTINQDIEYFAMHFKLDELYYRHNREYTLEEVKRVLIKEGFKITKSGLFNSYTPFRHRRAGLGQITRLLYYFTTELKQSWQDTIWVEATK